MAYENSVYEYNENGELCVRVIGEGGGGGGSVDYNRVVEKIATIPSADSSTVGKVYMYMGETNSTYTHGYIYECVATQEATDVSFSGSIVSSWAVADFVSYLQEGGANYDEVTHGTLTYDASGNLWNLVGYDANGIEIMSFREYTPDLEDFGCVFASSTHQDGDSCQFTLTTEQSGKKWKRLDVQPNSGGVIIGSAAASMAPVGIDVGVSIGNNARQYGGIAIGSGTQAGKYCLAIGYNAKTSTANNFVGAIQIGAYNYTNSDANTVKIANANGNFEIMSADGTIPTARLTKVNTTVTLAAADWSSNTQTVNVTGMTATGVVMVSPDPTDQSAYTSAGILATAQAAGTLTFTCDTVPSGDLSVNVVML